MDDPVKAAMLKWPNVPDVEGYLRLDSEGRWFHKTAGRIVRPEIVAFICRNYCVHPSGRWFFQNGPQRVWVDCETTPIIVVKLNEEADGWHPISHHQQKLNWTQPFLLTDDLGRVFASTDLGLAQIAPTVLLALSDNLQEHDGSLFLIGERHRMAIRQELGSPDEQTKK